MNAYDWRWGAALLVLAAGCASEPTWEERRAQQVGEFMLHLNNDNVRESWRDGLIDIGQRSPDDRAYVVGQCRKAYDDSMTRGGDGTGVLRVPGRRRVMEVMAALEDHPAGRALLTDGLRDDPEVRISAASGLTAWGDEDAVKVLLEAVLALPEYNPAHKFGLTALRKAATPARQAVFLGALDGDAARDRVVRTLLAKTLPVARADRVAALREVAAGPGNVHARIYALEMLVREEDPGAAAIAKRALAEGDPRLRPTALAALGAAGGDLAAEELEGMLRRDDLEDPADTVRGLYEVGSDEALSRALNVLTDAQVAPATRAAVARGFVARLAEQDAPAAYRAASARHEALGSLRDLLEEQDLDLVVAAVEAIGQIGRRGTDVDPLLGLLKDPDPALGRAVAAALGQLGGEFAAASLLELVIADPGLRAAAAAALASFAEPRDVPVGEVIDLLEDEDVAVRAAALQVLLGLAQSDDDLDYRPDGDEAGRAIGVERWRRWWAARSG